MRILTALVLLVAALLAGACGSSEPGPPDWALPSASTKPAEAPKTASGHPRLLVTKKDLPRLRSWARADNPIYSRGLVKLAAKARKSMDAGDVPGKDTGSYAWDEFPTEGYAELFAFMSLIDPSAKARADYGRRARKLLMTVIDEAAGGASPETPWRDPMFSVGDRSRWQGEAFGLTVDWAYRYFSKADKTKIRKVFLRWAKEQYDAYPLTELAGAKPSRTGRANDPALVADTRNVRYSLNNYYIAHARNIGLNAMALDPADDPGGKLRAELAKVEGQWLFVLDKALRTAAQGGLSPEGFEYGPDAMGRLAQLLYAMGTAGKASSPQSSLHGNPFWGESIEGFLHSLPPVPTQAKGELEHEGQIWQGASYGDEQTYMTADAISLFGPLALDAARRGDGKTVDTVRWIVVNTAPGGREKLLERVGNTDQFLDALLYFLVLDPGAGPAADPRPALPKRYFAPALGRTLARTDDGRFFAHKLSYNTIDHMPSDGNSFDLFRGGEWVTKARMQYESQYTDYTNTLTVQNDRPEHTDKDDYRYPTWTRGGQWLLHPAGDPVLRRSLGEGFVALNGDATNLYNSTYEGVEGVAHASRSTVWLEPDHVVTYDRAVTKAEGRFKRVWVQTPALASLSGRLARVDTPGGQRLFVRSLLPADAAIDAMRNEGELGSPAVGDPMTHRLRIEATGAPRDTRFLTVVQGADGGADADETPLLRGGAFEGTVVRGTAVLFARDLGAADAAGEVSLPGGVERVLVTGLRPGAAYEVTVDGGAVRVSPGGSSEADEGGTVVVNGS